MNRAFGIVLVAVFAASWLMPGGLDLFRINPPAREVVPPIHSGTPWARYLAPEGVCRGDGDAEAPHSERLFTMRCLLDWARRERGLPALPLNPVLSQSASLKASEIVRCNEFSHTPCGMPFEATFRSVSYPAAATGENLVWGESGARTPRLLMDSWLHSKGHRENLFRPEWREQGLALLEVDTFLGRGPAAVWVHEFGRPSP
jgi:Uncharacterized protein with SCP/PR1 domains